MPLKVDVQYNPGELKHFLHISNDKQGFVVSFHEDDSVAYICGLIEDGTNNYTLTKSHKKIYHQAYEDTNKKLIKAYDDLSKEKLKYAELKADHLELLGIMKKA